MKYYEEDTIEYGKSNSYKITFKSVLKRIKKFFMKFYKKDDDDDNDEIYFIVSEDEFLRSRWPTISMLLDDTYLNEIRIKKNKLELSDLLDEANKNISILQTILQDTIDLNMLGNEEERIKEWKIYRILLMRIDVNQSDIEWPVKPE